MKPVWQTYLPDIQGILQIAQPPKDWDVSNWNNKAIKGSWPLNIQVIRGGHLFNWGVRFLKKEKDRDRGNWDNNVR